MPDIDARLIEECAKAIFDQCEPEISWGELQEPQREHLRQEARACLTTARQQGSDRLAELEKERDHWKANHDQQVRVKQAILDRPDLQDRAKKVKDLLAGRDDLATRLAAAEKVVEAARAYREKHRDAYADARYQAVWAHYANHGGKYDGPFWINEQEDLDAALAACPPTPQTEVKG